MSRGDPHRTALVAGLPGTGLSQAMLQGVPSQIANPRPFPGIFGEAC